MINYYTSAQEAYIQKLYEISSKSAKKSQELYEERFGEQISIKTITSRWKRENKPLNSHGGARNGLSKEVFLEIHEKYDGNIGKMFKDSKVEGIYGSESSLVRRCKTLGLSCKNFEKTSSRKKKIFESEFPGRLNFSGKRFE